MDPSRLRDAESVFRDIKDASLRPWDKWIASVKKLVQEINFKPANNRETANRCMRETEDSET